MVACVRVWGHAKEVGALIAYNDGVLGGGPSDLISIRLAFFLRRGVPRHVVLEGGNTLRSHARTLSSRNCTRLRGRKTLSSSMAFRAPYNILCNWLSVLNVSRFATRSSHSTLRSASEVIDVDVGGVSEIQFRHKFKSTKL
jgi:hypothetical protein